MGYESGSGFYQVSEIDQEINSLKTIDETENPAFVIRQDGDSGDVFVIDSTDPSTAHASPPEILQLNANGGNAFAGSSNRITFFDADGEISSGTQSGRMRGMDVLLKYSGNAVHSGSGGEEIRAYNASTAWNSTSTCASMVGMQNFIACGGGGAITSGLVTDAYANMAKVGFNTNAGGSYTNAYSFHASTKGVDATHTITNYYGVYVDDCDITGITNGYAVYTGKGGEVRGNKRITSADSPYTLTTRDFILFVNTDGGAVTVNLPAGAEGTHYRVINSGSSANDVTLTPDGAEHLMGAAASQAITDGNNLDIYYNSTDGWY